MKKQEKENLIVTGVGIAVIVGAGLAGAYAFGATVIGGVLAGIGIKGLLTKIQ